MTRRARPKPDRPRSGSPRTGPGDASELRLPVWQFVRLMVQAEERVAQSPDAGATALMKAWGEVWKEVDGELTRLGEADAEAFAELMMEREVVLEDVTPRLARAAAQALATVVRAMKAKLKAGAAGGEGAEDLRFEIAELEKTLGTLPRG